MSNCSAYRSKLLLETEFRFTSDATCFRFACPAVPIETVSAQRSETTEVLTANVNPELLHVVQEVVNLVGSPKFWGRTSGRASAAANQIPDPCTLRHP